jgi:hypothetical protein
MLEQVAAQGVRQERLPYFAVTAMAASLRALLPLIGPSL